MRKRRVPAPWPLAITALVISVLLIGSVVGLYLYQTNDSVFFRVQQVEAQLYAAANPQADTLPTAVAGATSIADLSGSSDPNDPAYGLPDGLIDSADFFYYLDLFVAGCP